jgi:Tol biopolymer transport system component
MNTPKRQWTIRDTLAIKRITSTDVSPDGNFIAFTVMLAMMTAEKSSSLSQVYLSYSYGNPPRQLTFGEFFVSSSRWSPDGRSIATISQNNIWLMSLKDGNALQITNVATSVSNFKRSPDGSMIVFFAAEAPSPEADKAVREKNDICIVDQGVNNQRLYLMALEEFPSGQLHMHPLTGSDLNFGTPEVPGAYAWSPDGKRIVFSHSRSPSPNDMLSTRTACLNLQDGSIHPLDPESAMVFDPSISPDGNAGLMAHDK